MYRKHDVPQQYVKKWQKIVDLTAEIFDVPVALIMRVWPEQIEVLVASLTEGNPYRPHEKVDLGTGLYCETVMATQNQLLVPNALEDTEWANNPDIKLNMIHYLGVPLIWPDGSVFGTLCVLDDTPQHSSKADQKLLWQLKEIIESDFSIFYHSQELEKHKADLEDQAEERANELETANEQLQIELSERKLAEEELREQEKLLRTVAENYPNSYLSIIEKDLKIGFTSGQEFKKLDLDPESFVGLTLEEVFEDQVEIVKQYYLDTFKGKETSFELFINNQYQLYRTVPLIDETGEVQRILAVVENITERKLAEQQIVQFNHILEESLNEIYIFDAETLKFINVNRGAQINTGYSMEELKELTPLELKTSFSTEQFLQLIKPLRTREKEKIIFYTDHKRKDNSFYPVEVHLQFSEFMSRKMFIAIILDITERKRAEEKLKEQLEELQRWHSVTMGREERVQELKSEVNELLVRLEESIRYPSQETSK